VGPREPEESARPTSEEIFRSQVLRELDQIRGEFEGLDRKFDGFIEQLVRVKIDNAQRPPADQFVTKDQFKAVEKKVETFVTKQEFWPVRLLVYLFTSIILTAVFGAIVSLVVKSGGALK